MALLTGAAERALMRIVAAVATVAVCGDHDLGHILCGMAGVAGQIAMRSRQRILGLLVVIVDPARPRIRVMARRAVRSDAAFVVLVLVALRAGQRRALVGLRPMTFLARHDRMLSDQRKPADVVIELGLLAPTRVVVALLAAGTQLPFVRVVLAMARQARGRQSVAVEVARMTGVALHLGVRASQRILRLVVIEADGLPFALIVAGLAFCSVSPGMDILQLMTGRTGDREPLVLLADVARRACNVLVRALQREFGPGMIERLDAAPDVVAVAAIAGLPEISLVGILLGMTAGAGCRRLAKRHAPVVTPFATPGLMGARELKVRIGMIEGFPIQLHDIERATLVIGMAGSAVLLRRGRLAAVKAFAQKTIEPDLLVTGDAQPRLRLRREGFVAFGAIALKLGVPLDQRAGHHELFQNVLRPGRIDK